MSRLGKRGLSVAGGLATLAAAVAVTPAVAQSLRSSSSAVKVVGNAVAGKRIFRTAGCAGCHTLKAAKAKGTVGPDLDLLKPAYALVVRQVTNGGGYMPAFQGKLSTAEIRDVAAFVYDSTHVKAKPKKAKPKPKPKKK